MTVLVAYSTAHGSTKGVAERIGDRLSSGVAVDVRAADTVGARDLAAYSAVVLGSAIHNGRWLTPASALLARIREQPARPLWLFSVCTVGETTSFLGPRVSDLARRRRQLPADIAESGAPHRYFAGAIEKSHWSALGRAFFVVTGGRYGDHRDWADIDRWADTLGARLAEEAAGP